MKVAVITYLTVLILLLVTACGGGTAPATENVAEPAAATSALPQEEAPTAEVEPTQAAEPVESATVEKSSESVETMAEEQTAESEATAEVMAEDTPTGEVAAEPQADVDWLSVEGKTADNLAYLGNPEAAVTIVDYSDFLWTACRSYVLGTEPELKETYVKTGQARLVFNPMLDHGDRSLQAHQAAECAAEQGNFWPMHDIMFERQGELYGGNIQDTLKVMAAEIGLDSAQFNPCLDEQRHAGLVQSQDNRRHALGIRTRPTFDINGQLVVGAQGFGAFQGVIEPLLTQ